jgi:hypothetical protein
MIDIFSERQINGIHTSTVKIMVTAYKLTKKCGVNEKLTLMSTRYIDPKYKDTCIKYVVLHFYHERINLKWTNISLIINYIPFLFI